MNTVTDCITVEGTMHYFPFFRSLEAEEVLGEAEEVAGTSSNLQATLGSSSADSVKAKVILYM